MRVLLDENLPRRLLGLLGEDLAAVTVAKAGWKGKKNGELLAAAEEEFDVLLTMDRGLEHQQNLSRFDLAIVRLVAPGNTYEDLAPLMAEADAAIRRARSGRVLRVGGRPR
jgi:predicted nuclease of predicted toxin-antitoxin system